MGRRPILDNLRPLWIYCRIDKNHANPQVSTILDSRKVPLTGRGILLTCGDIEENPGPEEPHTAHLLGILADAAPGPPILDNNTGLPISLHLADVKATFSTDGPCRRPQIPFLGHHPRGLQQNPFEPQHKGLGSGQPSVPTLLYFTTTTFSHSKSQQRGDPFQPPADTIIPSSQTLHAS